MKNMNDLIAVSENTEGIIGKIVYYSLSGVMVDKQKFIEIGENFQLPKVKPARESKSGAYRNATTAIKDRIVSKTSGGTHIYRIYCRDNKKDQGDMICRELVKETLDVETNRFEKLANILFDRQNEIMYSENLQYDYEVDARGYCEQAEVLYERFQHCYSSEQIDSVVQDQLERMQASKINMKGNLYFVPITNQALLNRLEDYLNALSKLDLNGGIISINSMDVVDSEKQRSQMTKEFYYNYKREIEDYQDRIQNFINNGGTSKAVIDRWLLKIDALRQKKETYENVLKQELSMLDSDFAMLRMQSDELQVRNVDGQLNLLGYQAA